jgi:hypothetical protein
VTQIVEADIHDARILTHMSERALPITDLEDWFSVISSVMLRELKMARKDFITRQAGSPLECWSFANNVAALNHQ